MYRNRKNFEYRFEYVILGGKLEMANGWKNKIINHTIGAVERDEYQRQEIHRELAVAGIILWWLSILAMFIMLVIDTMNNTFSIGTAILFCLNMVYSLYTVIVIKKNSLIDTECATEEEYIEKRAYLRKEGIKDGLSWGIQMFIFMSYIFPYLGSEEISVSLFDVILWTCGGTFFGLCMYWMGLSNLKKLYETDHQHFINPKE
jgi:hypothetical protein